MARLGGPEANEEDLAVSNATAVKPREAVDSVDFYVRYGRALHARAMREMLRSLLRSLGRRRVSRRPAWEVVWPATKSGHCGGESAHRA
jgi:hypothetical protein